MLVLAAYLHRIDPFIVEFPHVSFLPAGIRWYGMSYLLGFFLAWLFIRKVTRTGRSPLKPEQVGDMVVAMALWIVAGGRLGYVLFYDPELLVSFTSTPPWWGVLAIQRGGMASHGGILGAALGSLWYARKHQIAWPHLLDLAAFGTPIGLFFGRIANYINGELYGRAADPSLPWAVLFPHEIERYSPARLSELAPAAEHLGIRSEEWKQLTSQMTADPVAANFVDAAVSQIIDKLHQSGATPDALATAVRPLLTPRHPSQLYQALLEGLTLMLLMLAIYRKPQKPGVLAGWFVLGYGVLRVAGEFFREPDAGIGYQWLGLTRGQWISAIMLIAGPLLIVLCSRRKVDPMGGWRATPSAT